MATRCRGAALAGTLATGEAGALPRRGTLAATRGFVRCRRGSLLLLLLLLELLLLLLLLLLLHLSSVNLRLQKLNGVVLLIRIEVCEPIITLLHHEVLDLERVGLGVGEIQSGRARCLPIVEPVVLHVNLNLLLGLARRTNCYISKQDVR